MFSQSKEFLDEDNLADGTLGGHDVKRIYNILYARDPEYDPSGYDGSGAYIYDFISQALQSREFLTQQQDVAASSALPHSIALDAAAYEAAHAWLTRRAGAFARPADSCNWWVLLDWFLEAFGGHDVGRPDSAVSEGFVRVVKRQAKGLSQSPREVSDRTPAVFGAAHHEPQAGSITPEADSVGVACPADAAPEPEGAGVETLGVEDGLIEAALDVDFYMTQVGDRGLGGLPAAQHYDAVGWRQGLDPSEDFSTWGYLTANPDIAQAGINPLLHYLQQGRHEGRRAHPSTRRGGAAGAAGNAEWVAYEDVRARGLQSLEGATPDQGALDFTQTLLGADLAAEVRRMTFGRTQAEPPLVSIVIPTIDQELITSECLLALSRALPKNFGIEVIIFDNGSSDGIYQELAAHPEINYIKSEWNMGYGPACNKAVQVATGKYIFFLNNDVQIAPGCLESLVEVMSNDSVGIAGPKLLSFDGRLQEAGCLLNADGSGRLIGYGADPRTPRYNYRRDVEHISGAAVLVRADIFREFGGFDPMYAPAYCEDADLSLKVHEKGLRIVYEPGALAAHHLSRTSNALSAQASALSKKARISRNRRTLQQRWLPQLSDPRLRTLAFYLPQYHPIPENDLWWGKGFTDWTNLAKARPNYNGHNQPKIPADLGYYDLRNHDILQQQADLAQRYGLSGFCYYYYNFSGRRILQGPLEKMLETGKPDFPFCLCWANENWTRRWDGRSNDILMRQAYSDDNIVAVIDDMARYFAAGNYIKVDGRPLVLIYRLTELPSPKRLAAAWRNRCRALGIGEICIAMVESFHLSASPENPANYGCDFSVEFPAHGMVHDPAIPVDRVNPEWTGSVHDYRELALAFMRRVEAGFPRLRSVLVGWDTTPRHPNRSLVLENATPGALQAWLEWTYLRTIEQNYGDSRIVFINAWNEWCEGSYLEPDVRDGHGHLQAVSNAIESARIGGGGFGLAH